MRGFGRSLGRSLFFGGFLIKNFAKFLAGLCEVFGGLFYSIAIVAFDRFPEIVKGIFDVGSYFSGDLVAVFFEGFFSGVDDLVGLVL